MKNFLVTILICVGLLSSCISVATPSGESNPVNTVTPLPSFTPSPTQTITPTSVPNLQVNKRAFVTVNAITNDSSAETPMNIWAVGGDGFIVQYTFDGYPLRMDSPEPVDLYDVDFVSPDDGWIVGEGALILHWNGINWEVSKPPVNNTGGPYSYDLYSVAFNEANDGWAGGCTGSEGGEYFLVYHWDGTAWSEVSLSDEGNLWACARDIVALSSTDVWMVGTGWNEGKEHGVTVHWDGINWEIVSELVTYSIDSISALSSDNIWAITRSGIVLNWNGVEWSEKAKLDAAASFSGPVIFAREPNDIFVVSNKVWHWNGTTWIDLSSYGNLPIGTDIKDIVEGTIDEGGHPSIYMVDSFGILYSFTYENFR